MRGSLVIVGLATCASLLASCATRSQLTVSSEVAGSKDKEFTFVATEFTRPGLDVSPDGQHIYFDLLGEIYRVSVLGGRADLVDLGDGWKSNPQLSSDGGWISFSRKYKESSGIWVRKLGTPNSFLAIASSTGAVGQRVKDIDESIVIDDGRNGRLRIPPGSKEDVDGNVPLAFQTRQSNNGRFTGFARVSENKSFLTIHDSATNETRLTECQLDSSIPEYPYSYAILQRAAGAIIARDGRFYRCGFDGDESAIDISAVVKKSVRRSAPTRNTYHNDTQIRHPSVSRENKELTFTARGHAWRLSGGERPERLVGGLGRAQMAVYSPDGQSVAFVLQRGREVSLRIMNLATRSTRTLLASESVSYANPAWSKDGKRIAFVEVNERGDYNGYPDSICFIELDSGRLERLSGVARNTISTHLYPRPSWSEDGLGIYYRRRAHDLNIGELVYHQIGKDPIVLMTTHPAIQDMVASRSGRYVALQERLGIAILPLPNPSAPANVPIHVDIASARSQLRFKVSGPDYVWWGDNEEIYWSVQNEVFESDLWMDNANSSSREVAAIKFPEDAPSAVPVKVFANARIIPMVGDLVIERGAIVTDGRTIKFVGTMEELPDEFRGKSLIDVEGKTIIPGLIDVHAHRSPYFDDLDYPLSRDFLAEIGYGVTTVFDPQIRTIKSSYLMDLSRDDEFIGPTFYGSGAAIMGESFGGEYASIGSLDDARGYVNRQSRAGSPMVKSYMQSDRQVREWLASAAIEAGVGVASHAYDDMADKLSSIEDGYKSLEHRLLLNTAPVRSDVIQYLVESGIHLTPTLAMTDGVREMLSNGTPLDTRLSCLVKDPDLRSSRSASVAQLVDEYSRLPSYSRGWLEEGARLLNNGVRISIGGHGNPPGLITHWEMWALALAGAEPMSILKAATIFGAEKLGKDHQIGSLEYGKDADFVVLDENPLDSIFSTTNISGVVRRGRYLEWPDEDSPPQAWPAEFDWKKCQDWNFGVPKQ